MATKKQTTTAKQEAKAEKQDIKATKPKAKAAKQDTKEAKREAQEMHIKAKPTHKIIEDRRLFKQCRIAGVCFHHLGETWENLSVGSPLVLVREPNNPHDKNAIAVALEEYYEAYKEGEFDLEDILGYIPREENADLAMFLDFGMGNFFECNITSFDKSHNEINMHIYLKSRPCKDIDTINLLRAFQIDEDEYQALQTSLTNKGFAYFRFGGFPPELNDLPKEREIVLAVHKGTYITHLSLMYVIATRNSRVRFFLKSEEYEGYCDDCSPFILTNIQTIALDNEKAHPINDLILPSQPQAFLSPNITQWAKKLFD